jgi:hypothetical protein
VEAKRIDWVLGDVVRIHGTTGLEPIFPTPAQPLDAPDLSRVDPTTGCAATPPSMSTPMTPLPAPTPPMPPPGAAALPPPNGEVLPPPSAPSQPAPSPDQSRLTAPAPPFIPLQTGVQPAAATPPSAVMMPIHFNPVQPPLPAAPTAEVGAQPYTPRVP